MVSVALHGEDPEYLEELAIEVEDAAAGHRGRRGGLRPTLRGQQGAPARWSTRTRAHGLGVSPRASPRPSASPSAASSLRRFQGPEARSR